jgi:single-stranded-DNA-specific exonuclease
MAHPELIDTILTKRGIVGEYRDIFLNPDYDRDTRDPFLMHDMHIATERLLRALEQKETIAIYADFDADGIPAAVILHDFFRKVGHEELEVYIPHRHHEGYGFHTGAIDSLKERGVSLIVTVDVGTVAHDAVEHANACGIDVIVTDHHEPHKTLPTALAVVNPKLGEYPFRDLCGAGVAFKLAQATMLLGRERALPQFSVIPVGWEKWLLDMVAIATVADMVPLIGENRTLVTYGLMVLRKSPRLGIHALCKKARADQRFLTEEDIGFVFAPRINAASRMDEPELAFRLLSSTSPEEAEALAAELEHLNAQRKGVVASLVKAAREKVAKLHSDLPVAVVGDPSWKPALLGLAANSVLSGRKGVVCLWGRDGGGVIKGSCRSDGSVNVVEMFRASGIALEEAGGHARAGGFSVSSDGVHTLQDTFEHAAREASDEASSDYEQYEDATISDMTAELYRALRTLAPFGVGNEKPTFALPSVRIVSVRSFGKENNHTEIMCEDATSGRTVRAFEFFKLPEDFSCTPEEGKEVCLVGTLEKDSFGGRERYALRIVDITNGV